MKGIHYTPSEIDIKADFEELKEIYKNLCKYYYDMHEHYDRLYREKDCKIFKQMSIDYYNIFSHLIIRINKIV